MGRLLPSEWVDRLTRPEYRRKRKQAVRRVCALAAADGTFLDVLRSALAFPNEDVVFWLVTHLGSLGPKARVAVPELIRLLGQRPPFGTRESIVGALARIAPDSPEAKTAIFGAFTDPDPHVRRAALGAVIDLVHLTAADLARIKAMENDPDEDVADWSEIALRNISLHRKRAANPANP
jgi:hypothetical protein